MFSIPVPRAEEIPTVTFTIERFVVEGENPLSPEQTESILAPFTGQQEGLEALQEAAQALEDQLRRRGFTFHRVIIPPQRSAEGELLLQVSSFKLNEVSVVGNQHFDADNILRSLPTLVPGTTPSGQRMSRNVQAANRHPSKRLNVTVRPSAKPDHIDAAIEVRDIRPQQVFASVNNRGSAETGETRWSVGYQHSNLWNRDHVLTASYTSSPVNLRGVKQVGLFYQVPLYALAGSLAAFFAYSDVNTGEVADFFNVSGAGRFSGVNYTHELERLGSYSHRLRGGIEDKLFENDIDFLGTPIGVDVGSRPASLAYQGEWQRSWGQASFHFDLVRNIPGGEDNTAAAYAASRFGAEPDWGALRYGFIASYALPRGFDLRGLFEGQHTGEPLISGEQFGIGGALSVRGFEERELAGDDGERVTVEVLSPPWKYDIQLLGFADWGVVRLESSLPGELSRESIASIGVGARWHWKTNLSLAFDLGYVINGAVQTTRGESKLHANVFFRY